MVGEWSLGSVASEILLLVEDVPTSISGEPLMRIANRAVSHIEQYTGVSVGSVNIALQYQGPILAFAIADTLDMMNLVGADVSNVRLGDFSVSKGSSSNLASTAVAWRQKALDELRELGHRASFYKALG